MESGEQEFVIQLPGCRSYGPYVCSANIDIERHVLSLAEASNLRVVDTPFRVKLPKTLGEHILVVAYPLSPRAPFDVQESIVVYGVECGLGKTLTENEIRNQLRASYPAYDDGGRCFSVYQQSEANNIEPTSTPRYGRGTIFVAADPDSYSPYSPPSGCTVATPTTNLALHHSTSESHTPITATSGPEKAANYVMPNQNLVLANSPNNDDTRKLPAQVDNAPTQALIPDRPHLEQKPPLQNLEYLGGGTTLQSVLVTPSTEQHELAGPLPCSGKDLRAPTIVVDSPSEDRGEGGEREAEIMAPQTESSNSVPSSPNSALSNQENFLATYRRQRSLSGEDMVAPDFPKSPKWMVTGRTLSLPPNINDQQSEEKGLQKSSEKSTENLCVGSNRSSIQRTQSDLCTLVHRKSGLLLDCGTARSASDDRAEGRRSLECEKEETKTRRRSMPDLLGVQRQQSGGDLIEAVIPGLRVGVPKALLAQGTSNNGSRQCLASTIHEAEREEESEIKSSSQAIILQPQAATPVPQSETSLCQAETQEKSSKDQCTNEQRPKEMPARVPAPLFRLGSLNDEMNSRENNDLDVQHQMKRPEQPATISFAGQEMEKSEEGQLEEKNLQWRQQVHIMEHVYNGECALGNDCPRPPTDDCLRQMSGFIEGHRNGLLSPPLTEWLKNLIRAHCSWCRDPGCKVPHVAVGCAPAGTVESYGTSSGSAIASELACCPYQAAASSDQEHPVPAYQAGDYVSVDMDANVSTSEQVREFYGQQSHGAESAYPHRDHGANFTDNPQPRTPPQTGGCCATTTNGTPPNNINPIVCTSPNYHPPRPNLLPGVHHQGPIPATTNDTERKNLSPYPSTGFLPPAQLYNRAVYRRDPTPRSPIQQASDVGNGMLNRDQACYIHPNQRGRNVLRDHLHSQVLSPSGLPDVRTEGFPHSSKYSSIDVGVLIYCSELLTSDTGFSLGALGRPPNPHKADKLGSGGNGSVFGYFQNGKQFAVKKTTYRQIELQAWLKLDHPNVLPLFGVMWGGHCCYQFMPKMTSDLSAVMRSVGDLCTLVRSESRVQWENVLRPNVYHVLKGLVSGVKYLHDMGIQHYDLKSSNILICRSSSCHCADIFCCECPVESKCEIRISDFDSVKLFSRGLSATSVPDVACKAKADTTKVLGTPYYRAPEQFKQMCGQRVSSVESLEGPWCDMWAIGVIVTQLCLGKPRTVEREKVHRTMVSSPLTLPSSATPTPEVEGFVARERLSTLRERCIRCQQLAPLEEIAALCLEPDFKKRITAERLLTNDFFL